MSSQIIHFCSLGKSTSSQVSHCHSPKCLCVIPCVSLMLTGLALCCLMCHLSLIRVSLYCFRFSNEDHLGGFVSYRCSTATPRVALNHLRFSLPLTWVASCLPVIQQPLTGVALHCPWCYTAAYWGVSPSSQVSNFHDPEWLDPCLSKFTTVLRDSENLSSLEWFCVIPSVLLLLNWVSKCHPRCSTANRWGCSAWSKVLHCHSM